MHPSHGEIAFAFFIEALAFAVVAVVVRRRFQGTGLLVLAAFASVCLALIVSNVEPFVSEFADVRRLPVTGTFIGVAASAAALDRLIRRYPEPDILPEIAVATIVFVVGVIVGIVLAGMTVLVIA